MTRPWSGIIPPPRGHGYYSDEAPADCNLGAPGWPLANSTAPEPKSVSAIRAVRHEDPKTDIVHYRLGITFKGTLTIPKRADQDTRHRERALEYARQDLIDSAIKQLEKLRA